MVCDQHSCPCWQITFKEEKYLLNGKESTQIKKTVMGEDRKEDFFGNLSFLSQSNDSVEHIEEDYQYKFVDDLTVLEIVNPISIGMASFNTKSSVPSDIPIHNRYIPPEHLKTQAYINEIMNGPIKFF